MGLNAQGVRIDDISQLLPQSNQSFAAINSIIDALLDLK
jgi:hypothetical protein